MTLFDLDTFQMPCWGCRGCCFHQTHHRWRKQWWWDTHTDLFSAQLPKFHFLSKFSPHSIPPGNGPTWAQNVKSSDYELICPKKANVPVTNFASCNLAAVPAHAVVTRTERRAEVIRILQDQQVNANCFAYFNLFFSFLQTSSIFWVATIEGKI